MNNEPDDPTGADIAQALRLIGIVMAASGVALLVEAIVVAGVYAAGGSL